MRENKLTKLVIAGLFAAIVCVTTMVVSFQTPMKGYVNAGDCFVLLSGFLLGPLYGSLAAAIGSAFADIFLGYTIYAPATFVIKGAVALSAYYLFTFFSKAFKNKTTIAVVFSGIIAELIMIAGYYLYDGIIFLNLIAPLADIPGNALQALFGIVTSSLLFPLIKRIKLLR